MDIYEDKKQEEKKKARFFISSIRALPPTPGL